MKLIREARMGLPKTFKTGAVVGTYPKPLLYLGFDRGGLDVIPTKAVEEAVEATNGLFKMNVTYDEVIFCKPTEIDAWLAKPMDQQPKVLAIDFTTEMPRTIDLTLKPMPSSAQFESFVNAYNKIITKNPLPWKTIVLDSITGFTDCILSHISSYNPNAFADARQWASQAGGKVRQTVLSMTALPCHTVFLLHSAVDKDDLTGAINEQASVYGKVLREDFFGLFSQVFYAAKNSQGVPVIWPSDRYPVKGIGPRWPQGLKPEHEPDFTSIYGKETV